MPGNATILFAYLAHRFAGSVWFGVRTNNPANGRSSLSRPGCYFTNYCCDQNGRFAHPNGYATAPNCHIRPISHANPCLSPVHRATAPAG